MRHDKEQGRPAREGPAGTGPARRPRLRLISSLILASTGLLFAAACEFKSEVRVKEAPVVAARPLAEAPTPPAAPAPDVRNAAAAQDEARASEARIRARQLTDAARFFAGLPVDESSEFYALAQTDIWKCNARRADSLWTGFPKVEARMARWAQRELTAVFDPTAPVYYPFSGPDIVFPLVFFPCAREYILVGLEPVGDVLGRRSLTLQRLDEMLSSCSVAVQDLIRMSFYRTKVMEPEFAETALKGVLPVLLVSLARMDREILDVERGNLDENGGFVRADEASPEPRFAVRIAFRKAGDALVQTLIYFSWDLSNGGLKKRPALAAFLANSGRYFSFLKSASYLCRKPYFSRTKKAILDRSYAVLQDDSGLAFSAFSPDAWQVSLYGTYDGPVKLFEDSFEQDLWEAMKNGAKPLGFRFGYSRASCLTLAIKRGRS